MYYLKLTPNGYLPIVEQNTDIGGQVICYQQSTFKAFEGKNTM